MDFGKFIEAIKKDSSGEREYNYNEIFQVLCSYLTTTMKAEIEDAEDCAQHALVKTYERIKENVANEPENIYSYLIKSAKNKYLRILFERNRCQPDENIEDHLPVINPVDRLVTEEEKKIFDECLSELPESSKLFIEYLLKYPEATAKDIALEFDISPSNVWTKKHRVIKKLSTLVQNKYKNRSN